MPGTYPRMPSCGRATRAAGPRPTARPPPARPRGRRRPAPPTVVATASSSSLRRNRRSGGTRRGRLGAPPRRSRWRPRPPSGSWPAPGARTAGRPAPRAQRDQGVQLGAAARARRRSRCGYRCCSPGSPGTAPAAMFAAPSASSSWLASISLAACRGEGARGEHVVGVGHERARRSPAPNSRQVGPARAAPAWAGRRDRADHRDPALRGENSDHRRGRQEDGDQRPGSRGTPAARRTATPASQWRAAVASGARSEPREGGDLGGHDVAVDRTPVILPSWPMIMITATPAM